MCVQEKVLTFPLHRQPVNNFLSDMKSLIAGINGHVQNQSLRYSIRLCPGAADQFAAVKGELDIGTVFKSFPRNHRVPFPAAEGLGQQFIQAVIVNPVRRFRKTQTQRIPVQTALLSLREIPCRGIEFPFKPVADRQEKALFQKTAIDRFPCFPGIGK